MSGLVVNIGVHTFNPSTGEARQALLHYTVSYRTARATQWDPVSKGGGGGKKEERMLGLGRWLSL